MQIKQQ